MKVILFDFFGVLSTRAYKQVIDTYIPESEREEWTKKLNVLDIGDLSEEQLIGQMAKRTGVSENEIKKAVNDAPILNGELFQFIEEKLIGQYRVGLLTNIPRSMLDRIATHQLYLFDPLLVSSDLKLIKPDRKIFEVAIQRCDVEPGEILFIDDKEENIDAAKAVGLNGLVFKDFSSFVEEITKILE